MDFDKYAKIDKEIIQADRLMDAYVDGHVSPGWATESLQYLSGLSHSLPLLVKVAKSQKLKKKRHSDLANKAGRLLVLTYDENTTGTEDWGGASWEGWLYDRTANPDSVCTPQLVNDEMTKVEQLRYWHILPLHDGDVEDNLQAIIDLRRWCLHTEFPKTKRPYLYIPVEMR